MDDPSLQALAEAWAEFLRPHLARSGSLRRMATAPPPRAEVPTPAIPQSRPPEAPAPKSPAAHAVPPLPAFLVVEFPLGDTSVQLLVEVPGSNASTIGGTAPASKALPPVDRPALAPLRPPDLGLIERRPRLKAKSCCAFAMPQAERHTVPDDATLATIAECYDALADAASSQPTRPPALGRTPPSSSSS